MNKQLDMQTGKQIIDSLGRLQALNEKKIISLDKDSKNLEAEKAGLTAFIQGAIFEHAGHLLGCWFVVKSEYEPLCNSMASIMARAAGIQKQRNAEQEELGSPEAKTKQ